MFSFVAWLWGALRLPWVLSRLWPWPSRVSIASVVQLGTLRSGVTLESLPPDLRADLMSRLSLSQLHSLIRASPFYYRQFAADRKFLLCKSIETTLGRDTQAAYAVLRSGTPEYAEARSRESARGLLRWLREPDSPANRSWRLIDVVSEDDAVAIAVFHQSVLLPLKRCYVQWIFYNLQQSPEYRWTLHQKGFGFDIHGEPEALSRTEDARVRRALYRFHLVCNLYGKGLEGNNPLAEHYRHNNPRAFPVSDILPEYFCWFNSWEAEEILCVNEFAHAAFNQVLLSIREDLDHKHPRWQGRFDHYRAYEGEGPYDIGPSVNYHENILDDVVSRGLLALYLVLFKMSDHEHLVTTMQELMSWPGEPFLELDAILGPFSKTCQRERWRHHPFPDDERQRRKEPMPFRGDAETQPPLAWTICWHELYSNLFGGYCPGGVRTWGYVMWDADRLRALGRMEELAEPEDEDGDWWWSDPRCNFDSELERQAADDAEWAARWH